MTSLGASAARATAATALLVALCAALHAAPPPEIARTLLPDNVERWTATRQATKPLFFGLFEELASVLMPSTADLPFDRSIAFLAGVSNYLYLEPDLPFVKNDIVDMRAYLLLRGGFDQVYVATESVVTPALIEDYMMNKFPRELGKRDRLLFYYSGHGADARGVTGYLQFSDAKPRDFARAVIAVNRVTEWSQVSQAGHMLFILDACSSGLAFSSRGGADDDLDEHKLMQTISGSGSRAVIAAGTANEQTFEVRTSPSHGNGVFTAAILGALNVGRHSGHAPAFLTVDQVFADLRLRVARFSATNQKPLNPRLWTLDDSQYRGSFIFLNPGILGERLTSLQLTTLGAQPRGLQSDHPPSTGPLARRELPQGSLRSSSPHQFPQLLGEERPPCTVRIAIEPSNAAVYLDGAYIGLADEVTHNGIQLTHDKTYRLLAELGGYRSGELTISPRSCTSANNYMKLEGEAIYIDFVDTDVRLAPIAKARLDELAIKLEVFADAFVRVLPDELGRQGDLRLNERRAAAIKDYLVTRRGIAPHRVSTEGRRGEESELSCSRDRRCMLVLFFS